MGAYLYVLRCADGSYYVGTTTAGLERRLAEHQAGDLEGRLGAGRMPQKLPLS
jgi:putative endonuclease